MTPKAPDYNSNIISRVDMMQYIYQQASEAIANLDMALDDYLEAQSWIEELKAYSRGREFEFRFPLQEAAERLPFLCPPGGPGTLGPVSRRGPCLSGGTERV